MDTTIPPDFQSLMNLLVNPLTMGMLLSWALNNIPLIKNPATTNWIKFAVAIASCFIWSLFVWTFKNGGLPTTSANWYAVLYMGVAVAFSNQAFYQVVKNLPRAFAWLLAWFGKTTATVTMSTSAITGSAGASSSKFVVVPSDSGTG